MAEQQTEKRHMLQRLLPAVLLLFLSVWLAVPASASVSSDFPEIFGGGLVLQAHRGYSEAYPENSIPAFRAAGENDLFGAMETDVYMTKDQVLVCLHDETIDRTTDGTGKVSDYTYEELQQFHLDDGFGWSDEYSGQLTIPTLEEFLEICKEYQKTPYIELKDANTAVAAAVLAQLHAGEWERKCVIISFSIDALNYVSEQTADYPLEYMPYSGSNSARWYDLVTGLRNGILRPSYSQLTDAVVAECKARGIQLETWTIPVGDAEIMNRVISQGVLGAACNSYADYQIPDESLHINRGEEIASDEPEEKPVLRDISECAVSCEDIVWAEGETQLVPIVRDPETDEILQEGTDYTLKLPAELMAGSLELTVLGCGGWTGENQVSCRILPRELETVECESLPDTVYNGSAQCPLPALHYSGTALQAETDYEAEWSCNTDAGTGIVTVSGVGNYTGTLELQFEIAPLQMGAVRVTLNAENLRADGSALCPETKLNCGSLLLQEGQDYTVSWLNNKYPGTATAVFTGLGNYSGEISASFRIGFPMLFYYIMAGAAVLLVILIVILLAAAGRRRSRRKRAQRMERARRAARARRNQE